MLDRQLHTTLRAFAEEAAWTLAAETAGGAELPFDVIEEGPRRGGPALYCYRPDTAGFIADRGSALSALENWLTAVHAVGAFSGLDGYLRSRGHTRIPADGRGLAEAALRAFLEALFEDLSEFVLSDERFERAYGELEEQLVGGAQGVEVIVPLLGVELESEEVTLTPSLSLARPSAIDRVPEAAAWDGEHETVLAIVRGDDEDIVADAPAQVRRMVTALRLYDSARVAMGPAAWLRTAGGPWQAAPTGAGGLPSGSLVIISEQEDELRGFCNLVWRRTPRGGPLAWALQRFDMGCERPAAHRITDHLLALRALLEPEGPDSGLLADRVATLCAQAEEHDVVAERIAHAASLEQVLIAGHTAAAADVELVASHLAGHLRAILRDVLCGHLDSDVRRLADELLEGTGA
ncbi:MAG: hypothetical protein JWM73_2888 [Solirubrobacterales bacterium]|nr:hypothetical protein [Solirubrobacterales bacterium]